jgi:MFS family permease
MTAAAGEAPPRVAGATPYAFYVAVVLMLASSFSFLDRMVLSLLIDPIRKTMGLSDTEVSLLAGLAFALFYVFFAFAFGRWVDTRGRRNAAVLGIALWSLATAACGLAGSFWRLFAARAAVGVGEASLNPVAYSMIPDYFPARQRGLGMAIYYCGASLGGGLAMLAGGMVVQWALAAQPVLPILGQVPAWQVVFIAVGLPGLLVAALVALTVREPMRKIAVGEAAGPPRLAEVAGYVGTHWRVVAPMFLGFSSFGVSGYAFMVWGPTYFMRLHHLTPTEVGLLFGLGYGGGGTCGVIAGGLWADALARRGETVAPIKVSLWASWLQAPLFIPAYLCGNTGLALALFCGGMVCASLVGGLQATMVQSLAPNRMRGLLAALYGATVTIVGLGVAPTLTAAMSDHVFGGGLGLGKALAVTTAVALSLCTGLLLAGLPGAKRRVAALVGPSSND